MNAREIVHWLHCNVFKSLRVTAKPVAKLGTCDIDMNDMGRGGERNGKRDGKRRKEKADREIRNSVKWNGRNKERKRGWRNV